MSSAAGSAIITVAQARAMEGAAPDLSVELIDGVIVAMGRASPWHAFMIGALHTALGAPLKGRCSVANESIAVGISADAPTYLHPDLTVVCGPLEYHPEEPTVILNPTAVFEVLSPGTVLRDSNDKLPKYKSMPDLEVIVYVEQAARRVLAYFRTAEGWEEVVRTQGRLELRHLPVTLDVDALYAEASVAAGGPP